MLRELKLQDAERMYEWMHDEKVLKGLQAEIFRKKTINDCIRFIYASYKDDKNCHRAIVDEKDIYQGTVSLKNINFEYKDAEFAIVLRSDAQGKGYAKQAMTDIMEIAFIELELDEVYWNVFAHNRRAISLYEKMGCEKIINIPRRLKEHAPQNREVLFFKMKRGE